MKSEPPFTKKKTTSATSISNLLLNNVSNCERVILLDNDNDSVESLCIIPK